MAAQSPIHATTQDERGEGNVPALRIENLSLHYGAVRALDDVSFDVARGSILCLLGSSGSGKSSALRLIAGLERPTSGRITHPEPRRRRRRSARRAGAPPRRHGVSGLCALPSPDCDSERRLRHPTRGAHADRQHGRGASPRCRIGRSRGSLPAHVVWRRAAAGRAGSSARTATADPAHGRAVLESGPATPRSGS